MLVQLLSTEERENINIKRLGRQHYVRIRIDGLRVGESIRVSREAFNWKGQTPKRFCNEIQKKTTKKFVVYLETSNTHWIIDRLT